MVLLHQKNFGRMWQIIHFKLAHNPPCTYFSIKSCSKHELTEDLASISNQEKYILG